jgi:hypothetical protein
MITWLPALLAMIVFCVIIAGVLWNIHRRGLAVIPIRYYAEDPPPLAIPDEEDQTPFFDEHDISAAEAHAEHPEFHNTVVEVNGIRVGRDGMPQEGKGSGTLWSWWRRGD